MQVRLRTLLVLLALAPLILQWLWSVRAEWLPHLPVAAPIAAFVIVVTLYCATLVSDSEAGYS